MESDIISKARLLRSDGFTYKQISSALDGAVSVDWCKRNLSGILKREENTDCIDALIKLATRPEGVSVYEANGVIMEYNKDKQLTKDQMRYLRTKAKAKDNRCLFRPDWVSTQQPQNSYTAFCAYLIHIQDELDNMVRWYCDSFPDTKPSSVRYEMLEYLKPSADGISLSRRISRAEQSY